LQLLANTQEGSGLTSHPIAETASDPKFFATRLLRRSGANFQPNEPLRVSDVAKLLRLSRATVYRLVDRGELPAFRVGNSIRFHPEELRDRIQAFRLNRLSV
jgi:excisionase family DNA binding protein